MATRKNYQLSKEERQRRVFSDEFKQKKVLEIERKQSTVSQICREYQVRSCNVYKWIAKYSQNYKKGVRLVVESESDSVKIAELKMKVAELERIVGQKQVVIDFQSKMIELAEETYHVDIKKKFESKQ